MKKSLQIYIHIPFCIKKCRRCTACVVTGDSTAKEHYLKALERELWAALPLLKKYCIANMKIGGGSPSVMNPDDLARLIRRFKNELDMKPHAEVEIEMMPQTICTASLTGLGTGGFNRVSLSMQSAVDSELETLDCGFSVEQLQYAVIFLNKFHWNDMNLDLMYGIPGQTNETWENTLRTMHDFAPTHVSLYPFSEIAVTSDAHEKFESLLLKQATAYLSTLGFERYTRYHFARNGHVSEYALNRINGMEYRGFGLGARSFFDGKIYTNTDDWDTYLINSAKPETIIAETVELSPRQLDNYKHAAHELCLITE
jgi:oxygen-independent coproporphyrinogen III oxidase